MANKTDSFCERIYLRILDGYLVPGGRLPSEQKLSESLNLSRTTVRAGLARQISAGVIERRGKRTFIHEDAVRRIETFERGPRRLIIAEVASNICNPLIETMFTKLHDELDGEYSIEVWLLSDGEDARMATVTREDTVICFGTPDGNIKRFHELAGFILLVGWREPGFSFIVPNNY
ncbi:MAG: winged helix-turn-helix domain-containing protein, partial [Victivallaceae bacterium]|nr:winged helix-turn-helix domain-containing protein [Victivallaceae bacterium]